MNQLKDKGVDTVAVVSVNDAFVMANWAKSLSAGEILMLADGNGDFAKILGMQKDCHAAGMGTRSLRYALIIKHGIVKYVGVDKSGLEKSSVESVLDFL
jgi:peroxiredoxin